MTPEELIVIGCEDIHWNENWNGGFHEYFLPLEGNGRGLRDSRLSVSFGDLLPRYKFMAWIVLPQARYGLKHVKTINQFEKMYHLLSGKHLAHP